MSSQSLNQIYDDEAITFAFDPVAGFWYRSDRLLNYQHLEQEAQSLDFGLDGDELAVIGARAFNFAWANSVLIIGAGLELPKILAAQCPKISVIEPNERIAFKAAARYGEIKNIRVYLTELEDFSTTQKFDLVIMLSGFKEGINNFERISNLLTPCGSFLFAASNELTTTPQRWQGCETALPSTTRGEVINKLAESGFRMAEEFLTFPSPLFSRLILNVDMVKSAPKKAAELINNTGLFRKGAYEKEAKAGLLSELAPGWFFIAHKHRVHAMAHTGWFGREFLWSDESKALDVVEYIKVGDEIQSGQVARLVEMSGEWRLPKILDWEALNEEREALSKTNRELILSQEKLNTRFDSAIQQHKEMCEALAARVVVLGRSEQAKLFEIANLKRELNELRSGLNSQNSRRGRLEKLSAKLTARIKRLEMELTKPAGFWARLFRRTARA